MVTTGAKLIRMIVKNDAVKSDPPEVYGWRAFAMAGSACFGGMLFGFDIGTIGGVLELKEFRAKYKIENISPKAQADLNANIASTLQAGCFVGCFIASWFADKYGRKAALQLAGLVTIIGCIFQAVAMGHLPVMYIGRLIAGLGVGGASMVVPLYISENAPRAIRGGLTGLYQLFIATGTCLAFWVNYGSLLHLSGSATVYIVPLALQALPAVLLIGCMSLNKESPRFLAKQDRWEEANAVLARMRNLPISHEYVQAEIKDIADQLEHERMLIAGATVKDLLKEMFTIPGNRKRALLSIGLMICQQMTGTNAINYYAPQIFKALGLEGNEVKLFATGIYGIVKMVGCLCFLIFAADSLGRRRSLLWTSIAQGLSMYYIGLYMRIDPPVKGAPVPPAGYFALVCVFLFACFFQFGWGPVCWIYVSEIPAARLRSLNVAIAAATQWLFNFVVARATPNMMATVGKGGYGTFLIYGSFCFIMFFFVWFLVPETKGLSLEKMDDLFGLTEMVKNIEADRENHAHSTATELDIDGKTNHREERKEIVH
ncbi:general substrate transporter [Ampelomyces quisqualis]|uniref:General substrate transporter n=1 Tax=Ampelomyces quisqualis TaxID=50730 RepID=A0A6A5QFS1_AMPQU|nr:general substrate transporter [Ampelomyces quisqualis]